jgi:hypothetical protein
LDQLETDTVIVPSASLPPAPEIQSDASPADGVTRMLTNLKYHLNSAYPGVYEQESDDNKDPGTDERISTACIQYVRILYLSPNLCDGLHQVLSTKTANVFNEGYVDNLRGDLGSWVSAHVNSPSKHEGSQFHDLPVNNQVEFSGHVNIDFAAFLIEVGADATEEQIISHLKLRLIGQMGVPVDRLAVLSYLVDGDQKGIDVDLSVLPPIEGGEGHPSTSELANIVQHFLASQVIVANGESSGHEGGAVEGDGSESPTPTTVHIVPFSAFHGEAALGAAPTPTAASASPSSQSVTSSAHSISASLLLSVLISFLFI